MEEGRRMFQIFAARMFQQRVLTAYREKIARERQQRLIEEIEEENRLDVQREAKKQREAQRRKDKKRQQKLAKEEEKTRKETEKAAEQAAAKAEQEKRLEEQRKKKEEQRKKKEAERKAQEEDRSRKAAERQRRLQEERDRQAEQERKQREAKEQEKKRREETKRKEREEREAKEKELQEQRTKEEEERKLQEEQEKEKKTREALSKTERETKEHQRRADDQVWRTPKSRPAAIATPSTSSTTLPNPLVPSFQQHSAFATPTVPSLPSTLHHPFRASTASQTIPTPAQSRQTSGQSMFSSPRSQHIAINSPRISPSASSTAQLSGYPTVPPVSSKELASVPSTPVSPLSNTYRNLGYGSPVTSRNPLTPNPPPGLSQRYQSVSQDTSASSSSDTTSTPTSQFRGHSLGETPLDDVNAIGYGQSSGGSTDAATVRRPGIGSARRLPSGKFDHPDVPFSPPPFDNRTYPSQASQASKSPKHSRAQGIQSPQYLPKPDEKGSFGRNPLDASFPNLTFPQPTLTPNRNRNLHDSPSRTSSTLSTSMPLFPPSTQKLDADISTLANKPGSADLLDSSTPITSSTPGSKAAPTAGSSTTMPDKLASSRGRDPFSSKISTHPNPLTGEFLLFTFLSYLSYL